MDSSVCPHRAWLNQHRHAHPAIIADRQRPGNCLAGKKWPKLLVQPGIPVRLPWQRIPDERILNSGKPPARGSFLGIEEVGGSIPLRSTNATD